MPSEQVILFIIGTVVILFGAYYVTYFIGMKATGQTRAGLKNRNINLLDRYAIARDKQFCIIEVAGKVYIIGVTNHTMTLLDTIDAAVFAQLTEQDDDTETPWNKTPVGQYGNKLTRKLVAFVAEKTGKTKKRKKEKKDGAPEFTDSLKEAQKAADEASVDENSTDKINTTENEPEKTAPDNGQDNSTKPDNSTNPDDPTEPEDQNAD